MIEIFSIGSFFLNAIQFIRAIHNRTQDKNLEQQQQRAQTQQLADLNQKRVDLQKQHFDEEKDLQKQLALFNRESLFLVATKLGQHFAEERELQKQLASYNYQAVLNVFSELSKHFEEQQKLQRQLAEYNRQTLLLVTEEQRESVLALAEANKIFENWPLRLTPAQILGRYRSNKKIPLKILLASPAIEFDPFAPPNSPINPIKENRLEIGLQGFLEENYPSESPVRPAEFIDGIWDSKRYHGKASIIALHDKLKSEPILILEMSSDAENINLRIGYWGYGQESYLYRTISPVISLSDILSSNPNAANDALVNLLCFITSWFTDVHHLIYAECPDDAPPLLPKLLPALIKDKLVHQILEPLMPQFVSSYQAVFDALKQEQPYLVPELALQLAESLSQLADKSYARKYLNYSMNARLETRGITKIEEQNLFNLTLATLDMYSKNYVELLQKCLTNLGEGEGIKKLSIINSSLFEPLFNGKIRDRYGDTLYGI